MQNQIDPLSLDSLWASAKEAERLHPVMRPARSEPLKPIHSSEFYTLPENWTRGKGIALVHEESQTLLGVFVEYHHRKERGCSKLVKEDSIVSIAATKYVSGPQWTFVAKQIPSPAVATAQREIVMPSLLLAEIGVQADTVPLTVFFLYSGIMRAELSTHTTFHSPDNRTIITFPAGVNIYACMDVNAKVEMRRELQA